MRFFTLDWWLAQQTGVPPNPSAAYRAHLASIESSLPRDLVELERSGALHDAKVRALRLDLPAQTFELELVAHGPRGETVGLRLCYGGVVSLNGTADPECGLGGPSGFGDLGYTEVHLIDGALEHCLLFSSAIELRVRFKSFEKRPLVHHER